SPPPACGPARSCPRASRWRPRRRGGRRSRASSSSPSRRSARRCSRRRSSGTGAWWCARDRVLSRLVVGATTVAGAVDGILTVGWRRGRRLRSPAVRFGVLGPITAWTDAGEEVPIQGVKVRAVLADLVVHVGEAVTADRLVDDVWGESPGSRNPAGTLSSKVSQLRRAFEAAEPGARSLLRSPPGYELAVDPAAVDAVQFTRLLDEARAASDPAVVAA